MLIATMTLVAAGEVKCLAGHVAAQELAEDSVLVLRKDADNSYSLHALPVTASEQQLRAFLAAEQSEAGELVTAILRTVKPKRKPREKAKR